MLENHSFTGTVLVTVSHNICQNKVPITTKEVPFEIGYEVYSFIRVHYCFAVFISRISRILFNIFVKRYGFPTNPAAPDLIISFTFPSSE